MTHEEIKILISAYIDGEVNPSEKNIVEEHLKTCESCQKDLKMYKAMSSSLSKWSGETLSPDEEIKIQRRFDQRRAPMLTQVLTEKRTLMSLGTTLALTIIVGFVVMHTIPHSTLQSRLKSVADDLADQYSSGNSFQMREKEAVSYAPVPSPSSAAEVQNGPVSYSMKTMGFVSNKAPSYDAASFQRARAISGSFAASNQGLPMPAPVAAADFLQQAKKDNLVGGYGGSYIAAQVNYDRKIMKNADMTLKVQSAQNTQSTLQDIVGKYNGTVNSLNMYKLDDGSRRGVMVFSVSPQSLDSVLMEIRKLGEIDSENQSGSDVTNQYTYLQTRLTSYEAERERLEKALKKSANDLGNNIYLQGQISNIEENMNGLQNNLKELDKQSFMSTVTVTFYDIVQVIAPKEESLKEKTIATLKNDIKATLVACYTIAVNSFSGIVIVLSFLFQIGLWALLFWGIYLIVRRFFK